MCLLSSQADAAGLLDVDLDDLDFYSYDDLISPQASAVTSLFGVTLSKGTNPNDRYINGMLAKDMNFADFVPVLGTMLTEIDAAVTYSESSLAAYLKTINSNLAFYLPRLDASVDEVEGKLQNVYTRLGDVLTGLTSIDSHMQSDHADLLAKFTQFDAYFRDKLWFYATYSQGEGRIMNYSADFRSALSYALRGLLNSQVTNQTNYLGTNGKLSTLSTNGSVAMFTQSGFLGLSRNLVGMDVSTSFSLLSPDPSGGLSARTLTADNILDALGIIGTQLQNPLAKLQYVLADDDDIELKDKTKENQESFTENFTGDGDGAVSGSQIKDVSGLSSNVKKTFEGAGSIGDVFSVLNDSNNFLFFSQEVADDLDQTNAPAAQSAEDEMEAFLDDFWFDEDGRAHLKDTSFWNVDSYLEDLK